MVENVWRAARGEKGGKQCCQKKRQFNVANFPRHLSCSGFGVRKRGEGGGGTTIPNNLLPLSLGCPQTRVHRDRGTRLGDFLLSLSFFSSWCRRCHASLPFLVFLYSHDDGKLDKWKIHASTHPSLICSSYRAIRIFVFRRFFFGHFLIHIVFAFFLSLSFPSIFFSFYLSLFLTVNIQTKDGVLGVATTCE